MQKTRTKALEQTGERKENERISKLMKGYLTDTQENIKGTKEKLRLHIQ